MAIVAPIFTRSYAKQAKSKNRLPDLDPFMKEVLVGVILSDGWIEKPKVNARFRFEQTSKHIDLFFHLYVIFSAYCKSPPKLRDRFDKRTNKVYSSWLLYTVCDPAFTEIHSILYKEKKNIVPENIMMGPASLAFLIMGDGWRHNKGVTIATNAFSIADNVLLIEALNSKFNLNCRMVKDHGDPSIHIPFSSLP